MEDMEKHKSERMRIAADIEQQIWRVFDILRAESIASEDYYVVLFLLSLYKDGIVSNDILSGHVDVHENFIASIHKSNELLAKQYLPIYLNFNLAIKRFSSKGLTALIQAMLNIDKKGLSDNFSDIFDVVLYRISRSRGRYGGESIQPVELTRFICALADLPEKARVFNPFAGLASFGVYFEKGQNYFGQEINRKTWALGALRIMAYERPSNFQYICDDSILNWPDQSEKFDLIVANPPFGMRLNRQYREINPTIRTIEHFLIEKGVKSLHSNGKLIAIMSRGFLYRDNHDKHLRKYLIEEDLIDTIISLPGGLLLNTEIPLAILVIDKNKKRPGKVVFIDAESFVESNKSREKILNDHELLKFIRTQDKEYPSYEITDNQDLVKESSVEYKTANSAQKSTNYFDAKSVVDTNVIRESHYNLDAPRYFQTQIEDIELQEKGVKFKKIGEFVRGEKVYVPEGGKLIRIRDLKNEKLDFKLNLSEVEVTEPQRSKLERIDTSCLLLATRWKTLKPTWFEFTGEAIFLNRDIVSFKVDENIVDIAYIINELQADYVQEQLKAYRQGAAIPMIKRDDLLAVVIKLPSLEEQRAKIQGIIELSGKITALQRERDALRQGESNKLYESVSTLKHSLGKPMLNIGSSLRNIEKALSRFNVDWEQVKLNERYDITIKDSFESIYSNLKFIHSLLKKNETALDVANYKLEEIDVIYFIKEYVKRIKSAEKPNVSTILDIHPDIENELKNIILLKGNSELLEIALNAIVENANRHAFTDQSKKYKLEFRVGLYSSEDEKTESDKSQNKFDTHIKIDIANNGKPFPENYTIEKLIRNNSSAGETGNTGQGGFDLNEIIKYHNNGKSTLKLITSNLASEFTTIYSFLIPFNR